MIKRIIFFILALTLASNAWAASKESLVKKGNALYKKGDFNASLKNYEEGLKVDPESAVINFNLGTALYKDKKYDEAIAHLQKGLLSDDPLLKKNAHFNLGDALYAHGVDIGEKQVDQAIGVLEESLRQFTEVINVDDKDKDAQYNRDIVQKQLELLKKKKQQQQNQQNQNQNKDQKQDKEDQGKGESQDKKAADSSSQNNQSSESYSKPENKDAEDKKEEQKSEQGFSQSADEKEKLPEEKKEVDLQPKPGEMTKEEAKALLKQFEQSPESTGLINFDKRKTQETSVLKDW